MAIRSVSQRNILAASLAALFFPPLCAAQVYFPQAGHNDLAIGEDDRLVADAVIGADTVIDLRWGDAPASEDVTDTMSMLRFENVTVDKEAHLTLSLRGKDDPYLPVKNYWVGAAWKPTGGESDGRLSLEMERDTLFVWGFRTDYVTLEDASVGFNYFDGQGWAMFLLQEQMKLDDSMHIAVGTSIDRAKAAGVNFLVADHGALVIDREDFKPGEFLIEAGDGAKLHFEAGSALVLKSAEEEILKEFVNRAGAVTGLGNVTIVDIRGSGLEGHWEEAPDGSLSLVMGAWQAKGKLADPVNEMHRLWQADKTGALNDFFEVFATTNWAHSAVERNTLLQKALGSTLAMDETAFRGSRFASDALLREKNLLPVSFELVRGSLESDFADGDGLTGRVVRDTEGAALSVRGQWQDWLWGARLQYEDANLDISSNVVNRKAADAESTMLSGTLYAGRSFGDKTLVADLTVSGVEDRLRYRQVDVMVIGTDDVSRKSLSLGLTGIWHGFELVEGWKTDLVVGAQLTDYLKTEYDLMTGGTALWRVEEENRLVASARAGLDISRSWHRYLDERDEEGEIVPRHDWLEVGFSGGLRVRAGDLDGEQTIRVGNARARLVSDDLQPWEAYVGLRADGAWQHSVVGVAAEGIWGPDNRQSWRLSAKVVWEL